MVNHLENLCTVMKTSSYETSRRRDIAHICITVFFKWFVSETPYLIHEAPKAPHITGCGVLLVVEGLCVYVCVCCVVTTPSVQLAGYSKGTGDIGLIMGCCGSPI